MLAKMPLSVSELREAAREGRTVDTSRLNRILAVDAQRGLLEVQAATPWQAIAAQMRPGDPRANVRTTMPTVGESIARNAAGPDGTPAVNHVASLTVVMPDGELRRVSREQHGELFALAVGGHGLFGALYSATLRLESLARAAADVSGTESLALPASGGPRRTLELLVPPAALEAFLADTRARCQDWHTSIEAVEVRRTLPESETALRWARREYAAVRLVLAERGTIGGAVRMTQLARELIDVARSHGGSFPIASTPEATRGQVEACYPELKTVLAEKRRIDPAEKLANGWYRHHRSLLGREACESRWNR